MFSWWIFRVVLLFLINISVYTVESTAPGVLQEVCSLESFVAICPSNKVISMKSALYGKLDTSRCPEVAGDSSCQSDVLGQADRLCSGKRECRIQIPNAEFEEVDKCLLTVRSSFVGMYECVTVSSVQSLCQPKTPILSDLSILSTDIPTSPCASNLLNMELYAKSGQHINVTLIDFLWTSSGGCVQYGHLVDTQAGREATLCGGQRRTSNVLMSISSSVLLKLKPVIGDMRYLLKFQVLGCKNLAPPPGAWMNRSLTEVYMGCGANGQVWHLRCVNGEWSGTVGQCRTVPYHGKEMSKVSPTIKLPTDIIIALIVAVAVLIGVLIITVGVICYKRSERKKQQLLQQQQLLFHTLRTRTLHQQRQTSEDYMSPSFVHQERPPTSPRSDSAYESIHVFTRTLPNNTQTLSRTNPLAPPSGTLIARQDDGGIYNTSQSSTYTNPQKYFILDKNLVAHHIK